MCQKKQENRIQGNSEKEKQEAALEHTHLDSFLLPIGHPFQHMAQDDCIEMRRQKQRQICNLNAAYSTHNFIDDLLYVQASLM